jgi:DNA invertase Pin-like site-specific DNA recombinase
MSHAQHHGYGVAEAIRVRLLVTLAKRRGFEIVREYEDAGISGGKGRDKRPAFNEMLKDAVRRQFDVCLVWLWPNLTPLALP